jgi:hypothetical protein
MKKIMRGRWRIFITIAAVLFASGCSNYSEEDTKFALIKKINEGPAVFSENEQKDLEKIKKVRKEVLSLEPVYDVAIVKGDKETVIAYKVKHMHRFRMKQIEKELKKRLEEKFPKEKFVVSSDYKIFLEVIELINDKKDTKFSDEKANQKLQKIIKMQKELT